MDSVKQAIARDKLEPLLEVQRQASGRGITTNELLKEILAELRAMRGEMDASGKIDD